jgi:radical SAM protein with 4Fe4S-binding SPASM domain
MTILSDRINIFTKLSPTKVLNGLKVLASYYYAHLIKKPIQWGEPISISIEPTTSCNLRCPECPSGKRDFTRPTGMLSENVFQKGIDELSGKLLYLVFYFQGEPFLNPSFLEMVAYASKKKIYTATSTNAHYLNDENAKKTVESGLDRLIISVDGTTQETYEQYRIGGNLEKVIEGTKRIVEWKQKLKSPTPHIIFQFLVVKHNEHQIGDLYTLAKSLGVNEVKLKTAQLYDYVDGSPLMPTIEKYSRYKKNRVGKYEIKNQLLNRCWKLWHSTVITWDGAVVPCCFDKDASHKMGNINEKKFSEIWQNQKYQNFRQALLKSRKQIDICKNCSEGTKVWA